jgi:hypothetical protein
MDVKNKKRRMAIVLGSDFLAAAADAGPADRVGRFSRDRSTLEAEGRILHRTGAAVYGNISSKSPF